MWVHGVVADFQMVTNRPIREGIFIRFENPAALRVSNLPAGFLLVTTKRFFTRDVKLGKKAIIKYSYRIFDGRAIRFYCGVPHHRKAACSRVAKAR